MATETDRPSLGTPSKRGLGVERTPPISDQVYDVIVLRIREGGYSPGDRLPSESELAEELGVARGSVRTALARVESHGHVIRRHGEGTFVTRRAPAAHKYIAESWSFVTLIEAAGLTPSIDLVSSLERAPTSEEAVALEIAEQDPVYELIRVFFGDGTPVIYTINILPAEIFVRGTDFDGSMPLDELLRAHCDQEIAYGESTTSAVPVERAAGERLNLKPGRPVIRLREIFYSVGGEGPICFSDSRLNTDEVAINRVRQWHR